MFNLIHNAGDVKNIAQWKMLMTIFFAAIYLHSLESVFN